MSLFKLGVNGAFILRKYGIRVLREQEPLPREARRQKRELVERARAIYNRHLKQTTETVAALDRKYEAPVLGDVQCGICSRSSPAASIPLIRRSIASVSSSTVSRW